MSHYVGRFAPTPSGPLHFGSLVAALGSYCEAHKAKGLWHLRIDDLDGPRNAPGAVDQILRCLDDYALHWDGEVVYQSQHLEDYSAALQQLTDRRQTYPCACTRKQTGTGPYPGTCASGLNPGQSGRSLRLRVSKQSIQFFDHLQGNQTYDLALDCGDFIIRRADHIISYHLATVVDDARQGITHVVRGADLLSSTARQIFIQQQLSLPTPDYLHLPLLCSNTGLKLSKQNHAHALSASQSEQMLRQALQVLGQELPGDKGLSASELVEFAVKNWQSSAIPRSAEIRV